MAQKTVLAVESTFVSLTTHNGNTLTINLSIPARINNEQTTPGFDLRPHCPQGRT